MISRENIEQIHYARNSLVGLNPSQKMPGHVQEDAFKAELHVNPNVMNYDMLRSNISSSASQSNPKEQIEKENYFKNQIAGIVPPSIDNFQHYMQANLPNQQPQSQDMHAGSHMAGNFDANKSRSNPYKPASPATAGTAKMMSIQNYDR